MTDSFDSLRLFYAGKSIRLKPDSEDFVTIDCECPQCGEQVNLTQTRISPSRRFKVHCNDHWFDLHVDPLEGVLSK